MEVAAQFWQDRPTFVTGSAGLLGGWLVRRLRELGARVVGLVWDPMLQDELVPSGMFEQVTVVGGDVRDQALLERILGEHGIETVFHLAAQTVLSIANRNPVETFETNVRGTWALLEACRRSPTVKQIVVASSDRVYGAHAQLPYTEEMPLVGRHPYDASKSCADLVALAYAATYELPVAISRSGNFYGGGDLNWSRIVPGAIRSVMRGEPPVIRSDGNYVRDYFYVEDAAAAGTFLAERLAERPDLRGQAFNFSNEAAITVLDLVKLIVRLMGSHLEPRVLNEVTYDIQEQYLSAAKARQLLGWKPLFSLEEGLRRTIEWYRESLSHE